MVDIFQLKKFYPNEISDNPNKVKHILKEYVELISLNFLSSCLSLYDARERYSSCLALL